MRPINTSVRRSQGFLIGLVESIGALYCTIIVNPFFQVKGILRIEAYRDVGDQ